MVNRPLTPDEIRQQQDSLNDEGLFQAIALYFLSTVPTHLDNEFIVEVEPMLNNLYFNVRGVWPKEVVDLLEDALVLIAELSEKVKTEQNRDRHFFRTAKNFGDKLETVFALLE